MARTICLDFDDTLCGHDDSPMPGTSEALAQLKADGFGLIVSSGLTFSRVDAEKISSPLYVNPRGYHFRGDWSVALPEVCALLGPG